MSIRWRDGDLQLMLYIRKNKRIIPRTVVDEDNLAAINAIDYEDLLPNMRIFGIPISIRISSNNTWDDIKEKIMSIIEQENLYNYIYKRLKSEFSVPANIIPKLNKLDQIKNNYYEMLEEAPSLIGENIPFYLEPNDINIIKSIERGSTYLKFVSPQNNRENKDYFIDFMITDLDSLTGDIHSIYKKIYKQYDTDDGEVLTGKSHDDPEDLDRGDWFDEYTANFFNIGLSVYNNDLNYVTRFHRILWLKNVMSDLHCESAASFASQSNHNIIGRTNETFSPIKYYKVNDKFWIEFYERCKLNVPVSFNDNVTFTMDMVFLQNRQLLYS